MKRIIELKQKIKKSACWILSVIISKLPLKGIPVILYHRVGTEEDCKLPPKCVSINNFQMQLNYLIEQGYYFATLDEVVNYVMGKITLPKRTVVITFDDGFKDNYKYAFSILKEKGIKATIFINTNFIGKRLSMKEAFGSTKPESRDVIYQFLTWHEIIEMSNNGINFEPHTHNHADLTIIEMSEIEKEIIISKAILEEKLKKKVEHLSFPFGKYNKTICDVLKKMEFKSAWAVRLNNVKPKMYLYALPRKQIGDISLERFKIKISHYEKWVFLLYSLLKKIKR